MKGGDVCLLLGHQPGLVGKTGSMSVRDAIRLDPGQHFAHRGALAVHLDRDRQSPPVLEDDVVVECVGAGLSLWVNVRDARILRMDFAYAVPGLKQIGDAKLEEALVPQNDTPIDGVSTRRLGLFERGLAGGQARVRDPVTEGFWGVEVNCLSKRDRPGQAMLIILWEMGSDRRRHCSLPFHVQLPRCAVLEIHAMPFDRCGARFFCRRACPVPNWRAVPLQFGTVALLSGRHRW